jgi:hypothetical protein
MIRCDAWEPIYFGRVEIVVVKQVVERPTHEPIVGMKCVVYSVPTRRGNRVNPLYFIAARMSMYNILLPVPRCPIIQPNLVYQRVPMNGSISARPPFPAFRQPIGFTKEKNRVFNP